jgi:hypothetical protein
MVDYYAKLEEIVDRTEEIIEREGLRSVFAALAEICSAKARTKPHNIVALDALQHTSRCCPSWSFTTKYRFAFLDRPGRREAGGEY